MCTLYHSALNGRKASDWLRPVPCQQEGDKLPKGPYQSDNGYSTRVHLPGHLPCDPSSRREASHVSSQGKEPIFVTHEIYSKLSKTSLEVYSSPYLCIYGRSLSKSCCTAPFCQHMIYGVLLLTLKHFVKKMLSQHEANIFMDPVRLVKQKRKCGINFFINFSVCLLYLIK